MCIHKLLGVYMQLHHASNDVSAETLRDNLTHTHTHTPLYMKSFCPVSFYQIASRSTNIPRFVIEDPTNWYLMGWGPKSTGLWSDLCNHPITTMFIYVYMVECCCLILILVDVYEDLMTRKQHPACVGHFKIGGAQPSPGLTTLLILSRRLKRQTKRKSWSSRIWTQSTENWNHFNKANSLDVLRILPAFGRILVVPRPKLTCSCLPNWFPHWYLLFIIAEKMPSTMVSSWFQATTYNENCAEACRKDCFCSWLIDVLMHFSAQHHHHHCHNNFTPRCF